MYIIFEPKGKQTNEWGNMEKKMKRRKQKGKEKARGTRKREGDETEGNEGWDGFR